MNLQLAHTFVKYLELKRDETIPENEHGTFNLDYKEYYSEENKKEFQIHFILTLKGRDSFLINLTYVSLFSTNEDITDTFKNSNFTKINAPAIAFPYLRSYLTMLSLNSGYEPIILPTLNFLKYKEQQEEKQK